MRPDATKKLAATAPKGGPSRVVIGGVIAAVLIVGVVVAVLIGNSGKASDTGSGQPAGVVGGKGGGILTNAATAKSNAPTLEIYSDFQCTSCANLEAVMGAAFASMAKAGDIKLILHALSFVDTNVKNDSSTRSANAAACASDAGKPLEYHAAVFAGQPEEEGAGYTDANLTEFAKTAGITGAPLTTWQTCTSSKKYAEYVTDVQTAGEKAGVFDTPTVRLNGKDITKNLTTADALIAQVKAATK
jgi:protein-disulfide isomerase